MKIAREVKLIGCGKFARSRAWKVARRKLHAAIKKVEWPKGSGKFTIYAESGKKRGKGNGVKPIKDGLMIDLHKQGYRLESSCRSDGQPEVRQLRRRVRYEVRPDRCRMGDRQCLIEPPITE